MHITLLQYQRPIVRPGTGGLVITPVEGELAPNIRPLIRQNKLWSWVGLRFDCYGYARWKGRLR